MLRRSVVKCAMCLPLCLTLCLMLNGCTGEKEKEPTNEAILLANPIVATSDGVVNLLPLGTAVKVGAYTLAVGNIRANGSGICQVSVVGSIPEDANDLVFELGSEDNTWQAEDIIRTEDSQYIQFEFRDTDGTKDSIVLDDLVLYVSSGDYCAVYDVENVMLYEF